MKCCYLSSPEEGTGLLYNPHNHFDKLCGKDADYVVQNMLLVRRKPVRTIYGECPALENIQLILDEDSTLSGIPEGCELAAPLIPLCEEHYKEIGRVLACEGLREYPVACVFRSVVRVERKTEGRADEEQERGDG